MRVQVRTPERCTGCLFCALACSLHREGGYNPRLSLIQPQRQITGLVEDHDFPGNCNESVADCCCSDAPLPCVKACFYGVLKAES